jgi:hydroxymethylpyrimidine/phosphomethylpyrimidine kinase
LNLAKVLTIAGSDSGGGAGIQADLKTFQEFLTYGTSVLTAVTAQNTLGVQGVYPLSPAAVEAQLRSVLDDIGADAVKTGMLVNGEIIGCVAGLLAEYGVRKVVVDPVMVAKGGAPLLADEAVDRLKASLLPQACLVTPNIPEACRLTGMSEIADLAQMEEAARLIHQYGVQAVLVKGGHLPSGDAVDLLYDGKRRVTFRSPRIRSRHTHGTGCTLSSAIAAGLALGRDLETAVREAKRFVHAAIEAGSSGIAGRGIGPLDHAVYRRAGRPDQRDGEERADPVWSSRDMRGWDMSERGDRSGPSSANDGPLDLRPDMRGWDMRGRCDRSGPGSANDSPLDGRPDSRGWDMSGRVDRSGPGSANDSPLGWKPDMRGRDLHGRGEGSGPSSAIDGPLDLRPDMRGQGGGIGE